MSFENRFGVFCGYQFLSNVTIALCIGCEVAGVGLIFWGIFTVRNEVTKVMFSQACVCPRGGGVHGPGEYMVQGVHGPGGYMVPGGCMVSGGCMVKRRVHGLGGISQHALRQTPSPERWPLLRTVRILLECILVQNEVQAEIKERRTKRRLRKYAGKR